MNSHNQGCKSGSTSPNSNRVAHLFLLNHALRCDAKAGKCKHLCCTDMKDLLLHMAICEDGFCNVRHCVASKELLNHFHCCEDCSVCTPVREALVDDYWDGTRQRLDFAEEHGSTKRTLTF